MLEKSKNDIIAFCGFSQQHWQQIWSADLWNGSTRSTPPQRRRLLPQPRSRPAADGHVLIEQHDESDGADLRYFSEHDMKLPTTTEEKVAIAELNVA